MRCWIYINISHHLGTLTKNWLTSLWTPKLSKHVLGYKVQKKNRNGLYSKQTIIWTVGHAIGPGCYTSQPIKRRKKYASFSSMEFNG